MCPIFPPQWWSLLLQQLEKQDFPVCDKFMHSRCVLNIVIIFCLWFIKTVVCNSNLLHLLKLLVKMMLLTSFSNFTKCTNEINLINFVPSLINLSALNGIVIYLYGPSPSVSLRILLSPTVLNCLQLITLMLILPIYWYIVYSKRVLLLLHVTCHQSYLSIQLLSLKGVLSDSCSALVSLLSAKHACLFS